MTGSFMQELGLSGTGQVGPGTQIAAFARVLPGARIGRNCSVSDHVFIGNDVVIGDNVAVQSGAQLWNGVRLANRVVVGPNATFAAAAENVSETVVEEGASIGANATILAGLRIGRSAIVAPGAVVTQNVPPNAVVSGNPAIIVDYQSLDSVPAQPTTSEQVGFAPRTSTGLGVGGCELRRMPHFSDMRGSLAPLDFEQDLPFRPQRSFLVYSVPNNRVRGEHAHRQCHQLLVAAHGKLAVVIDDGTSRREVELNSPTIGLHVLPMVWTTQYKFEPETVLLVFASHPYDPDDYIRDYDTYRNLVS
jgi:acetyltransferase-like isoleucine patch superfamily enzyme